MRPVYALQLPLPSDEAMDRASEIVQAYVDRLESQQQATCTYERLASSRDLDRLDHWHAIRPHDDVDDRQWHVRCWLASTATDRWVRVRLAVAVEDHAPTFERPDACPRAGASEGSHR